MHKGRKNLSFFAFFLSSVFLHLVICGAVLLLVSPQLKQELVKDIRPRSNHRLLSIVLTPSNDSFQRPSKPSESSPRQSELLRTSGGQAAHLVLKELHPSVTKASVDPLSPINRSDQNHPTGNEGSIRKSAEAKSQHHAIQNGIELAHSDLECFMKYRMRVDEAIEEHSSLRTKKLLGKLVVQAVFGTDGDLEHCTLVQTSASEHLNKLALESVKHSEIPDCLKSKTQEKGKVVVTLPIEFKQKVF